MIIKEINKYSDWTEFFNDLGSPSFLQSWEWGEVEKKQGYDVIRYGLYGENDLLAVFQIIKIRAKRGSFLFIPHGPIIKTQNSKLKAQNFYETIKQYLITLAKKEGFDFIRISPILVDNEDSRRLFQSLGFRQAPIYMHAETVWVINLDQSEEELLAAMRKTTRYLIKKALRESVVIEKSTENSIINRFWEIYEKTAAREKFTPFSKSMITDEFNQFNQRQNAVFLSGKSSQEKNYLASALIVFTNSTAFYHQGASIHTKIPVTYLLQWEAIKEAKKRGCKYYNFWGILKKGRTPKAWSGLTLFKQGFGGQQIDYVPTQDYIVSSKYWLTWTYENLLNLKRGV